MQHIDLKPPKELELFTVPAIREVRRFFASFPSYVPTSLYDLKSFAHNFQVKKLFVKNEAERFFDLDAYHPLGCGYAIGRYMADKLGSDINKISYRELVSPTARKKLGNLTFVTASTGSYGLGLAWTARLFHQKAVVYLPKGTKAVYSQKIKKLGAEVIITDGDYVATVNMAEKAAKRNNWIAVQDSCWPENENIPRWIMQGYATMALEVYEQLPEPPTHIFLQAGIGSLAAAVVAFFANAYPADRMPRIVLVEPMEADYLSQATIRKSDDEATADCSPAVPGPACTKPCGIAFDLLGSAKSVMITRYDNRTAAVAMRVLGAPTGEDKRIIASPYGSAGVGAVIELMFNYNLAKDRDMLGLNSDSQILCFNTEGATYLPGYLTVAWWGKDAHL